jgi:flagellar basal-body rod protein FlgB
LKPIEGEAPVFEKLEIFRTAQAMAVHAGARQAVVAQNMANADTPGYAAREIKPFKAVMDADKSGFGLKATRAGHLNGAQNSLQFDVTKVRDALADPNGNSVSLEQEMINAADVKRQHGLALAIYKSSLTILRTAISR